LQVKKWKKPIIKNFGISYLNKLIFFNIFIIFYKNFIIK
jgi:hypothetical protein